MEAGSLPIGAILTTTECECEFTAKGRVDAAHPEHSIFRRSRRCNDRLACWWGNTSEVWFYYDEEINRPGNVEFALKDGTEKRPPSG